MVLDEMEPEISTWDKVHHQVEVVSILKSQISVDNIVVFKALEQFEFVEHRLHALLIQHSD